MKSKKTASTDEKDKQTRIAILDEQKCKPQKCGLECKKQCPVNRSGKECISVNKTDKIALIAETMCIGCGVCINRCPFGAINIINIPTNMDKETSHRQGPNSFKLHRLPIPRKGQILGLVGANGTGKSTAIKILSGKIRPNLGQQEDEPSWSDVIKHFRGSELQNYFDLIVKNKLKSQLKPQYVDSLPKSNKGQFGKQLVGELMTKVDERGKKEDLCIKLELNHLMDRKIEDLSGGELQRFAIAITIMKNVDVYFFDEPTSQLDVKQRIEMAKVIREIVEHDEDKQVVLIEHDLSILDQLSDQICLLYGVPSAYGIVSQPASCRDAINIFLEGQIRAENMRFREQGINFKMGNEDNLDSIKNRKYINLQGEMELQREERGNFNMKIMPGGWSNSEITVIMGQNGTGKTTFIKMMAGMLKPTSGEEMPKLNVSYKPQTISPKFPGTVEELYHSKIKTFWMDPQFQSDVVKPLKVDDLKDLKVQDLSGGELQRAAIVLALGKPADVYLLDEPSAFLDSEQRIACSKVIRKFIVNFKKTCFMVEHDFIMSSQCADRIIVFDGEPGVKTVANPPMTLVDGMNQFLKQVGITFRRDPENYRPRINKLNSVKDQQQKAKGDQFSMDVDLDKGEK